MNIDSVFLVSFSLALGVMEKGTVRVTLSDPEGIVTGISYNDINSLLELVNPVDGKTIDHSLYLETVDSKDRPLGTSDPQRMECTARLCGDIRCVGP